jgi:signal transduction histidine kinase/CheY-like chemotaxis protein
MTPLPHRAAEPSRATPPLSPALQAVQARQLFGRARWSNVLALPLAALISSLLWPYQSPRLLLTWLVLKIGVTLLRVVLDVWQQRGDDPTARLALRLFIGVLVADALLYGAVSTWLVPAAGEPLAVMLQASAVCMCAVGFVVLCNHFGALLAFTLPLMVPLVVWQCWSDTPLSAYVGWAGTLFTLLVLGDGWKASRANQQALRNEQRLHELAAERAQALALAEQHSAVKSRFLATMSHEMRTPLHGILGIARQLETGTAEDPTRQLRLLTHAGEQLLTLIDDVLDVSQADGDRLVLAPAPFDLTALVDDLAQSTANAAAAKGLRFDGPPSGLAPCWVRGDAARLRQLLTKLTGNALKFTDHGGVGLTWQRTGDGDGNSGGWTTMTVTDSGPGFDPSQAEQLFEPFHLGDGTPMRRHGGAGLGLGLARGLARKMGGDLVAASGTDTRSLRPAWPTAGDVPWQRGACFTLRLPLPAAPAPRPAAPRDSALSGDVLLVEDNPVNALVAEAMLARAGLQVATVTDGAQAVDRVRRQRFDVVLMDCQMPVLDGISATRRIRSDEARAGCAPVPIVGLTASASDDDRQACLAAGMDDYLAKPFREAHLQGVLARYLPPA